MRRPFQKSLRSGCLTHEQVSGYACVSLKQCRVDQLGKVLDEVRRAIKTSGQSRYAISQATGISQAQLSRLMSGQSGLSIESLERLAEHLGLEVLIRPKRQKRKN